MGVAVPQLLQTSAMRLPEKTALVDGSRSFTYSEIARRCGAIARGLERSGLRPGDRVGVLLEPSVSQVVAILATSQAGGVFVPIHHAHLPHQVAHIVRDCGVRVLVVDAHRLSDLVSVVGECPSLELLLSSGGVPSAAIGLRVESLEEWCDSMPVASASGGRADKDLAALLYTSGSTGKPKGVMLSHANLVAGASIVASYLGITRADRTLAVLSFSFDAGLNQLLTAMQEGATLVLKRFLFPADILRTLSSERITGLGGVPTFWHEIVRCHADVQAREFPDLRYVTNTGGPLSPRVLRTLREVFPATKVFLMYGFTEAFRSTYLPPDELDRRETSIGRAIAETEIFVLDECGQRCRPGEVGELVHRGPTVALGYWGLPELTRRVWRPDPFAREGRSDAERVAYSGDLVKTDDDGFLYFVGRRDHLIKSCGFRISPFEVEEVLCGHARVREAAVIGLPDEALGQSIQAFIVAEAARSVDLADLRAFCAIHLPRYMQPRTWEIVSALPRTSTGKIDYGVLQARARRRSSDEPLCGALVSAGERAR